MKNTQNGNYRVQIENSTTESQVTALKSHKKCNIKWLVEIRFFL